MQLDQLRSVFRDVSEFSYPEWINLYDFVSAWRPQRCLDLGFGNGLHSLCIADAMAEGGWIGSILAIDEASSQNRAPHLSDLLERSELPQANLSISVSDSALSWAFLEMLREPNPVKFDLICIDGRKTWAAAGFNVLLAQRMLNPGGWIVLTGADHEFVSSWELQLHWVQRMPPVEQMTKQVNAVFELLVLSNPVFTQARRDGRRFFAQIAPKSAPTADACSKAAFCALLYRAQKDPDFRFQLVWHTKEALATLEGFPTQDFNWLCFQDSTDGVVLGKEFDEANGIVNLMRPAWDERLTRVELQQMIFRHTQNGTP